MPRPELILVATPDCVYCLGTGYNTDPEGFDHVCICVSENYDPDYEAEIVMNNYE